MVAADIFEIAMILLFGISWPFNIASAIKARTAKGTSIVFTLCVLTGYVAGITSKLIMWATYGNGYWTLTKIVAVIFYVINLSMLVVAIVVYFRNKKLDKQNLQKGE